MNSDERRGARPSAARLGVLLLAAVFAAELFLMLLRRAVPGLPDWLGSVLDAGFLAVLLLPPVYFLVYRPMLRQLDQRDEALAAVGEQAARFRSLFDGVPVGLYRTTPAGQILEANPALARLFGYPDRESLVGHDALNLFLDVEDRRRWQSLIDRDGVLEDFETPMRRRDGAIIHVRDTARVVRDADGRALYYDGRLEDVTARKQAEQALAASEARLAALFAAMTDVVIIYDAGGRHVDIAPTNPAALFRPSQDQLGKTVHQVLPAPQAAAIQAHIQRVLTERQTLHLEYALIIGGAEVWFDATVAPLSENTVLWVAHDLTWRRQMEQALRQFQLAIECSADAVFITTPDGTITYVNPAFEKLYGYSRAEALGKTPRLLKSGTLSQEVNQQFWAALVAKTAVVREITNRAKDGRLMAVDGTANPILDGDGNIAGFLAIQRDITQRKQAERIQTATFELAQAAISTEGLDELYRSIQAVLAGLMSAESFYVALYDPVSRLLSFPLYKGQHDQPEPPRELRRGLTEYVLRTGRALVAGPEVLAELMAQGEVELIGPQPVEWLGVPLKVADQTLGVLAMQSHTEGLRYTSVEAAMLEFVSAQVALAIARKQAEVALRQSEEAFKRLANTDALTGLYGRRRFDELARVEIDRALRYARPLAVMTLDIDFFKRVNDTFGHACGDLVLKAVGQTIREMIRSTDIPARYGGEEFVVLLPETAVAGAVASAERLRRQIEATPTQTEKGAITVTVSLGVCDFLAEANSTPSESLLAEFLGRADQALYASKRAGRNRVTACQPDQESMP